MRTITAIATMAIVAIVVLAACEQPTTPDPADELATGETNDGTDPAPAEPVPGDSDPTDPVPAQPDDPPAEPVPDQMTLEIAIDFDNDTPGYATGQYAGAGLLREPDAGALDADAWQVTGMSDGDLLFGEESATGDFARGVSPGGSSQGGLYAFTPEEGNAALGVQATASDFAPGSITLRVPVDMQTVSGVQVSFTAWWHNDQDRSTRWSVGLSADGETWFFDTANYLETPELADAAPEWEQLTTTVIADDAQALGLNVTDVLYVRWTATDGEGSGGRDEAAIDDIVVTVNGT